MIQHSQLIKETRENEWPVSFVLNGWGNLLLPSRLQVHLLKIQQQIIWIEENFVGWVRNRMSDLSCCFDLPQSHKRRVIGNSLAYELPTCGFSLVIKIREYYKFSPQTRKMAIHIKKWIASCKTSRKLGCIVHLSSHLSHLCSDYSTSLVLFGLLDDEFSSFGFLGSHLFGFNCSCELPSKS